MIILWRYQSAEVSIGQRQTTRTRHDIERRHPRQKVSSQYRKQRSSKGVHDGVTRACPELPFTCRVETIDALLRANIYGQDTISSTYIYLRIIRRSTVYSMFTDDGSPRQTTVHQAKNPHRTTMYDFRYLQKRTLHPTSKRCNRTDAGHG